MDERICTQTKMGLDHAWKIIHKEMKPPANETGDTTSHMIERLALVLYRTANATVHQIAAGQSKD